MITSIDNGVHTTSAISGKDCEITFKLGSLKLETHDSFKALLCSTYNRKKQAYEYEIYKYLEKCDFTVLDQDVIKEFRGELKFTSSSNSYAFVYHIYIPGSLLLNFHEGDKVVGRAYLCYNKTREEWGYKALSLFVD